MGTARDAMTDKFISIEGIAKRFPAPGGRSMTVFDDLWLAMARGEFVCIIGHSGCGKTTVLNILAGLDAPSRAPSSSTARRSKARASTAPSSSRATRCCPGAA